MFGIDQERQSKLLIGRANAGDRLTAAEKKLLKKVGPLSTDNTFDKERFWDSPGGRTLKTGLILGGTAATAAGTVATAKYILPKLSPNTAARARNYIDLAKTLVGKNKVVDLMDAAMTHGVGMGELLKNIPSKTKWSLLAGIAAPTIGYEVLKPTIDRMRFPGVMEAQAKKDRAHDNGVAAHMRSQLKKHGSDNTAVTAIINNIDALNELPVGNPKKKEELLEALKKIENGSKAKAVLDKIAMKENK